MRVNTVVATSALVLYQGLLVNAFPFLHSSTASTKRSINKDSRTYASAHELEHRANDLEIQKITYKRQLGLGDLDLGGGLLNGVLQPFSGVLQSLDVPTPQAQGLAQVPDASHPYVAPGSTDVRGVCPTLNTMANHGYVDHSGITTFAELANACQVAYGFGYDVCTFLSSLGLLAGGDLATGKLSIGGADSRVPNTLGPALGLSHHGPFETDNSVTRQDIYFGNPANFELDRWIQLVNIANAHDGLFDSTTMAVQYNETYSGSRSNNPEFNALVGGVFVDYAERSFIYRGLTNGSEGNQPDYNSVAPFFLNETFPNNWYRRSTAHTLPVAVADVLDLYSLAPSDIGENEGLGNFIPTNTSLQNLTPSQLACVAETLALSFAPGQFAPVIAQNWNTAVAFLNGAVKPFFASYDCPTADYTAPGVSAGNPTPGVSTQSSRIENGVYQ